MAYTSGRQVKSSKPAKPTTVGSATREVRKLIARIYGESATTFTVDSRLRPDPVTLASRVQTTVTYPESIDASDLACAVDALPGHLFSTWTSVAITVMRSC